MISDPALCLVKFCMRLIIIKHLNKTYQRRLKFKEYFKTDKFTIRSDFKIA